MNETPAPAARLQSEPASEFGALDLLIIFARRKKLMLLLPLACAVLGGAGSFLLAPTFHASATLLPPQQAQSGAAAILSQLGGVASAVSGGAGMKNVGDTYVAMLRSRTVADAIITKFQLAKAFDTPDSPEKTRTQLAANTRIVLGKEGLIEIEYEGRDQKSVAPIANAYVTELMNLTRVLAITEASQRRKFYEQQLEQVKDKLANAEMTLKQALDTHGVISVDADSRSIVETVGRLRAQITAKQIELSAMSSFVTENNQDYKRATEALASLRAELQRLENGPADGKPAAGAPAGGAKQAGLENIKVLREVKYYQMLYELLAKQYEVARLDEAKEASVIQVLDVAIEPERKFKPKRVLMVVGAGLGGLFLAMLLACVAEFRQRAMQVPARAAKLAALTGHLGRR